MGEGGVGPALARAPYEINDLPEEVHSMGPLLKYIQDHGVPSYMPIYMNR